MITPVDVKKYIGTKRLLLHPILLHPILQTIISNSGLTENIMSCSTAYQ